MRRASFLPQVKDYLLLVVCTGFLVVTAVLGLEGEDRQMAIGFTAFWALCTGVAVWSLVRKHGFRRNRGAVRVDVAGGTRFTQRLGRMWLLGLAVSATGALLLVPAWHAALGLRLASLGMVLGGLVVPLGHLSGWLGTEFFVFEPEGLRYGHRSWSFLLPWECMRGVAAVESAGTPLVCLWVTDMEAVLATAEGPEGAAAARAKVLARIQQSQRWMGCDFTLAPTVFGMDVALLTKALHGYAAEPARREDLRPRSQLSGT